MAGMHNICVECDERDRQVPRADCSTFHFQPYNLRKGLDTTTLFRICCRDNVGAVDEESFGVTRRRGRRIQKHPLPRLQVLHGIERDIGEEEFSGSTI